MVSANDSMQFDMGGGDDNLGGDMLSGLGKEKQMPKQPPPP